MWQTEPFDLCVESMSSNRCLLPLAQNFNLEKLLLANLFEALGESEQTLDKVNIFSSFKSMDFIYSAFPNTDVNYAHMDVKRLAKSLARIDGTTMFCLGGSTAVAKTFNARHLHSINPFYQELYIKEFEKSRIASEEGFCDQPITFNEKDKPTRFPLPLDSKKAAIKKMKLASTFFKARNQYEEKELPHGFVSQSIVLAKKGSKKLKKVSFWEFQVSEGDGLNLSSSAMLEYIEDWYKNLSGKSLDSLESMYLSTRSLSLKGYLMSVALKRNARLFDKQLISDCFGYNSPAVVMNAIRECESSIVICFDMYPKILVCGVW